jgi:hypothetical protein
MSNGASCSAEASSRRHRARQPLDHRRLTRPGSFPRLGERANPDCDNRGATAAARPEARGLRARENIWLGARTTPTALPRHVAEHLTVRPSWRIGRRAGDGQLGCASVGQETHAGAPRASGAALRPGLAAGSLQVTPPAQCRECASASLAKCHSNESEQHARAGSGRNKQDGLRAYR